MQLNADNLPENPEELAVLIDRLMAQGSGHVNITSDADSDRVRIDVVNSTDFCGNKGACCQPTEDVIDEDEE